MQWVSEIQAANWTLTYYKTLRLEMSPNSEWHGVAVGILNDSASDPYWARSSRGQKKFSTYFNFTVLKLLLLMLIWRSGWWSFVVNEAWSGGVWSFEMISMQKILLLLLLFFFFFFCRSKVAIYWSGIFTFHFFS